MKKQLVMLFMAFFVCSQVMATEFPQFSYPNELAAKVGDRIRPESPVVLIVNESIQVVDLNQSLADTRKVPRTLRFGQTDEEFIESLDQNQPEIIVLEASETKNDSLTIAQRMVVDFLRRYDQAIEGLELGLIYGYQGDLRRYALAQASLDFFQSPETIEQYNNYLINILKEAMDDNSSARAEQISQAIDYIQANYEQKHYSLEFLQDIDVTNKEALQQD